jgi:hypothetical protein
LIPDEESVTMTVKSSAAQKRVYRLAVYGVMSSGKTCILSALTLPRIKHPEGLSCSWIRSVKEHPLPTDPVALEQSSHPLHVGYRKLTAHREKLEGGDVPEGTKLSEGIMHFRFEFSDRRGKRHVELVDYAGELISSSAETLAARLREHMKECDALLILAEAPHPGNPIPLAGELVRLQSAFALLLDEKSAGPRENWPVVVLFNKWDRRGVLPSSATSDRVVSEFLQQDPPPPHASLVDAVINAVGDENVRCFPVSAFGGHEVREDGKEVPKLVNGMLQSFGLEDGFLWAIHRSEELEVERLHAAERETSWWAFWQLFGSSPDHPTAGPVIRQRLMGISPVRGLAACWKTAARLLDGDFLRVRTRHVARRFALKTLAQVAFLVTTSVAGVMLIETVADGVRYRGVTALAKDGGASDDELDAAETWLESYHKAPTFRHFASRILVLGRSKSLALRNELQNTREERVWKRVSDATEEKDKADAAEAYLRRFPAGPRATAAEEIAIPWRRKTDEMANITHLAEIERGIDRLTRPDATALQECDTLASDINALPHADVLTRAVTDKQAAVQALIAKRRAEIREAIYETDWAQFAEEYSAMMKDGRVADAAPLLQRRRASDSRADALIGDFAERAPAAITASVWTAIRNYAWDDARRHAAVINDVAVGKLLSAEALITLGELTDEVAAAEDEHLYSLIIRNKPACQDQINAYLTRARLKSMQSDVETYRQYLTKLAAPLDLTLVLSEIRWGSDYYSNVYSYSNDISVSCRGSPIISCIDVTSKADSVSRNLGEGVIRAGLREAVTLDVSITAKYGAAWTSNMNGGSGSWIGTIAELRRGVSIDAKGNGFTNRVMFSLRGLPTEPSLPPWHR